MKNTKKNLPVLCIEQFKNDKPYLPYFYIKKFEEHVRDYDFISKSHRHDFFFMVYFTQGSGTHTIDFVTYPIQPGQVFFMSPAQVHSWELSADIDGFVVFFSAEFYLKDFAQHKLFNFPFFNTTQYQPLLELPVSHTTMVSQIFEEMYAEFRQQAKQVDEVLQAYLNILLVKLSRIYQQHTTANVSGHLMHQIRQLETLINEHYIQEKSVQAYAKMMHLSVKQLNHVCKTALNKSTSELIQDRVVLEAKRLLVHSDLTIAQIGAHLEYFDNAYFARFFKKVTGLTPDQFRKAV
ncbi:helix-turn-helix domain-containing protein [uncultured Microscilla sp.]|uniref:helix-turn-helix domain-containing protein n=1 Tax=uncultured Microscilla sp. TaxID=432653 RepID=UPI00261A9052|nr:helix-turn-helix domain-containing protein [uncultured Microscilla sp.]